MFRAKHEKELLFSQPFEGHEEEKMGSIVSGAVIASNGKLTEKFEYISDLREANMNGHSQVNGDFKSDKKVGVNKYTSLHFLYLISERERIFQYTPLSDNTPLQAKKARKA